VIRAATPGDAGDIARIYNHYILETIITFEEETITTADITARIGEVEKASLPWLVAVEADRVVGYAYASRWKSRCAYRHSAETTVYVDSAVTGRGHGGRLYRQLLDELAARGAHTAIGGIALPNAASVALHERLGFTRVAQFREVGFKFNRWIDVAYWQRLLSPAHRA
jgi:phosphinothricin acetyltransferase